MDESFDIYLQFEQNIAIDKRTVKLRDAAKIYCADAAKASRVGDLIIAKLGEREKHKVMSALDVIRTILRQYPNATITILGENDFILSKKDNRKKSIFLEWVRTGLVCLIAFFGAAFSVSTFNNDVDVSLIFEQILVSLKESGDMMVWLKVSYSIGIPIGVLVFYNHFSKKKMYNDPTPLEVEMRIYEQDVNTASIINESRKEEKDIHE